MDAVQIISAVAIFLAGYILNMFYITVFFHRGLAHKSVELSKGMQRFIFHTAIWITGMDPIAWICMHRMHHAHSDTELDPHTPNRCESIWGMFILQLRSYKETIAGLLSNDPTYAHVVKDIPFGVHWLNAKKIAYLPYVLHIAIMVALFFSGLHPIIAIAYLLGIASHPIQGGLVNYFGHKIGYRNFDISDDSVNNYWVALITMGEGYQNNHHYRPGSAKFQAKWWELDLGYVMCKVAKGFGIVKSITS